jgi:hypothetical protein
VLLPADLVDRIERVDRDRDRFVARAVEHELQRREALLESLLKPHPETVGSGREALASDDDALVDLSAGTPVRWIEGRGWVSDTL